MTSRGPVAGATFDWHSFENQLMLNPRLPQEARETFQNAWRGLVEPTMQRQVGIVTSGSSGDSIGRLIVLSKAAFLANAAAVNKHFQVSPRDVWLKTLPDFHVGGLSIYARSSLAGSQVVESAAARWDPTEFCREVESRRATLTALVPTQLYDLVRLHLRAPDSVRATVIGGGRLEQTLREQALELGWPVYVSYGFTECASQVATAASPEHSSLRFLSHVDVRIGAAEHIEVRSPALLTGQILFSHTEARFEDPKLDGWFRTEDRGQIEVDGSLKVLGRSLDFVKIGGEGVLMSRLEERLESLKTKAKFASDAVVLAAFDERLGARVILISDLEAAGTSDAVTRLVEEFNSGVLPFERIREVFRVKALPRSAIGKLLRRPALDLVGLKPVAHT